MKKKIILELEKHNRQELNPRDIQELAKIYLSIICKNNGSIVTEFRFNLFKSLLNSRSYRIEEPAFFEKTAVNHEAFLELRKEETRNTYSYHY